MSGQVVALDTGVLIDAMQHVRGTGPENSPRPERCHALIQALKEQGNVVLIPDPAASEFIAGGTSAASPLELSTLSEDFIIAPLDFKAAHIAANIQRAHRKNHDRPYAEDRNKVKTDFYILGAAIAAGAACIYTTDSRLVRLVQNLPKCRHWIAVRDVPEFSRQEQLLRPRN